MTATDLTLLRQDTGELLPVATTEWVPARDPLTGPAVDDSLPLAWGDAIEAQLLAETGRTWEDIVADTHAAIAHGQSVLGQRGIDDVDVQPVSVNSAEVQAPVGSGVNRLDPDVLAALLDGAEERLAARSEQMPDDTPELRRRESGDAWVPPARSDGQRRRDAAVLAELGDPDRMTAYMHRGSSEELPGTVVGTEPEPVAEPRRTRWARAAGDILAWIGRGRP